MWDACGVGVCFTGHMTGIVPVRPTTPTRVPGGMAKERSRMTGLWGYSIVVWLGYVIVSVTSAGFEGGWSTYGR